MPAGPMTLEDMERNLDDLLQVEDKRLRLREAVLLHDKMETTSTSIQLMRFLIPTANLEPERKRLLVLVKRMLHEAFEVPIEEYE